MDWKNKPITSKEDFKNALLSMARDAASRDNAIVDENGNILFRLKTRFRWGRHKNNQLRDVFKVEPSYIEWCLNVASGFAIYEPDLNILLDTKVFDGEQLNTLCRVEPDNSISLDLISLNRNEVGFLVGGNIKEVSNSFSSHYLEINRNKISKGIDFMRGYQHGIPAENANESATKFILQSRSKIILKVPS